jgi:hypothetical protein
VEEFNNIQEDLRAKAEETKEGRRTRRLYSLIIFWAAGTIVCVLILFKLVLVPQE